MLLAPRQPPIFPVRPPQPLRSHALAPSRPDHLCPGGFASPQAVGTPQPIATNPPRRMVTRHERKCTFGRRQPVDKPGRRGKIAMAKITVSLDQLKRLVLAEVRRQQGCEDVVGVEINRVSDIESESN